MLAVMAMPGMQSVHALIALLARQVGMWFDSGPSHIETFAEPKGGCSEDPSFGRGEGRGKRSEKEVKKKRGRGRGIKSGRGLEVDWRLAKVSQERD